MANFPPPPSGTRPTPNSRHSRNRTFPARFASRCGRSSTTSCRSIGRSPTPPGCSLLRELETLKHLLEGLKPVDPIDRNRRLFTSRFLDVGIDRRNARDAYDAEVARRRAAAIHDILDQGGIAAVARLASQGAQPWLVGVSLADATGVVEPHDVIGLLDSEDSKVLDFADSYVARSSRGQLAWLLPFAEAMTGRPLVQARLLAASDDLEDAWAAANRLGPDVDAAYWKEFRTHGHDGAFALVNKTARNLLEHGRPAAALKLLASYCSLDNDLVEPQTVVDAFEALLTTEDEELHQLPTYDIEELLAFLRGSTIDEDVLASLEWNLLPALRLDASSPILERNSRATRRSSSSFSLLQAEKRPGGTVDCPAGGKERVSLTRRLEADPRQR